MNVHHQSITRAALRALGGNDEKWQWDDSVGGLVEIVQGQPTRASFAPLRDPGDAFQLEAVLMLDVTYLGGDKHQRLLVACPARSSLMSYITVINVDAGKDEALIERMRAVTQYAAMLDNLGVLE